MEQLRQLHGEQLLSEKEKLAKAARSLGFNQSVSDRLFESLTDSWLGSYTGPSSGWRSDISDDGCPFELSVALGGEPELRLLVEAQSVRTMDAITAFEAGEELNASLVQFPGVDLDGFAKVRDLFAPIPGQDARFSLWHAAVARRSGDVAFKVYLNPSINDELTPVDRTIEALRALGIPDAADLIAKMCPSGPGAPSVLYFSLDLDVRQGSRVKIYIAHHQATLDSLEQELNALSNSAVWDARQTVRTLAGEGPFNERPILSCLGFRAGQPGVQHTMHVPIRCYVDNDRRALDGLKLLAPRATYEEARRVVEATSGLELGQSAGHITYISTKRQAQDARVTLYLTAGQPLLAENPSVAASSYPESNRASERKIRLPSAYPPSQSSPIVESFHEIASFVDTREQSLCFHRLHRLLQRQAGKDEIRICLRSFAFWALGLQDIFRQVAIRAETPKAASLLWDCAQRMDKYEKGYMEDLERLQNNIGLGKAFESSHQVARDLTYQLVGLGFELRNDSERLVLALSLTRVWTLFQNAFARALEALPVQEGPWEVQLLSKSEQDLSMTDLDEFTQNDWTEAKAVAEAVFSVAERLADDAAARVEADTERRLSSLPPQS